MPSAAPHSAFAAFASVDFSMTPQSMLSDFWWCWFKRCWLPFICIKSPKIHFSLVYSGSWIFYLFWRCLYGVVILLIVLIGSVFYKSVLALPSPYRLLCNVWSFPHPNHQCKFIINYPSSILFLFGCIRGIYSPCFNSLRPFVVPEHLYTNAATWTSIVWQACGILAPVVV